MRVLLLDNVVLSGFSLTIVVKFLGKLAITTLLEKSWFPTAHI